MSYNLVDPTTGDLTRVAGGTLYADVPVGTIIPFGGSVIPRGYLLCNGQAVSRADYTELFAAIGTAFGAGDGSSTFNVPDLRECVMVGSGQSTRAILDEDGHSHDVYALGEFKDDQLQQHTHQYGSPSLSTDTAGLIPGLRIVSSTVTRETSTNSGRIGTTTHGKQVGVNYIIKAKQVDVPADFMNAVVETNSYSTIETVVGKWIDGKPIYRKVIDFGTLPNSTAKEVSHGILNVDSFVSINGAAFTSSKTATPIPHAHSDSKNEVSVFIEGTNVVIRTFEDKTSYTKAYVILEYTKTTD